MSDQVPDNVFEVAARLQGIETELDAMRYRKEALESERHKLAALCTHRYADGTSALEGSYFMTSCKLCRWDDL